MVADPQLKIEGPFDDGGNSSGPTEYLYLAEDAEDSAETDTQRRDIPTEDDEENILAPLTGNKSVRFNGVINPLRLKIAGYGNTKKEALRQYLHHLESLVLEEQGNGYKLVDDVRSQTYRPQSAGGSGISPGVLFDTVRWEFSDEEAPEGEWTLEGQITEGVNFNENRQRKIDNPTGTVQNVSNDKVSTSSIDIPLGEVETRRYERSIDLNVMEMVHESDQPNVGSMESGVQGEVNMEGRIADRQVNQDLWDLATQITNDLHGVNAEIHDQLTNRVFEGAVADSSTTINAGETDILEYRIAFDIGSSVA